MNPQMASPEERPHSQTCHRLHLGAPEGARGQQRGVAEGGHRAVFWEVHPSLTSRLFPEHLKWLGEEVNLKTQIPLVHPSQTGAQIRFQEQPHLPEERWHTLGLFWRTRLKLSTQPHKPHQEMPCSGICGVPQFRKSPFPHVCPHTRQCLHQQCPDFTVCHLWIPEQSFNIQTPDGAGMVHAEHLQGTHL